MKWIEGENPKDKNEYYTFPDDIYPIMVRYHMEEFINSKGELVPETMDFETSIPLGILLINEVVFENSSWYRKDLAKEDREAARIHVLCNDIFAWGCADCETLPHHEIENLYKMWEKDKIWGPVIWCCIQRHELPQKPVLDRIRKEDIWNIDELIKTHGLKPNGYRRK